MLNDLRFAVRQLMKSPGFTLVAISILALGLGANTAMFSVFNALLLRPLPYDHPEELVSIYENEPTRHIDQFAVAGPKYVDWRRLNTVFQEMGAVTVETQSLTGAGLPTSITVLHATPSYLNTWRMRPALGRLFAANDDEPANRQVMLLSHSLWQQQFGGRTDVIGERVRVDGQSFTIIGVLAAGGLHNLEGTPLAFVPLATEKINDGPGVHYYQVVARLKPGVSVEQSQAAMSALAAALRKEHREYGDWGVSVQPMRKDLLSGGPDTQTLFVLEGAVLLLLLIACSNIASLLLARSVARRREIAIRLALGGSRWRVIRQLLVECLLVFSLGGVAGVILADVLIDGANAWLDQNGMSFWADVTLDRPVLAFSVFLTACAGLLSGLVPAWQATRHDLQSALKDATRSATNAVAHKRALQTLTVVEIALAAMLLIGASLLVRTAVNLAHSPAGFDSNGVLAVQATITEGRHPSDRLRNQFVNDALDRIVSTPGVTSAAAVDVLPLCGASSWDLYIVGRPPNLPSSYGGPQVRRVSPTYFATVQVPLRRGRGFTLSDTFPGESVAIINQTIADQYFPSADPIGQRINLGDGIANPHTIVGVVGDERVLGLSVTATPIVYVPMAQGWFKGAGTNYVVNFVIRSDVDCTTLAKPVLATLRKLDPDITIANTAPLRDIKQRSISNELLRGGLLVFFSFSAVLLAGLGLYSVISNVVSQRTTEFGVRLALGAEPAAIHRLVLRQGVCLALIGISFGVVGALVGNHLLQSFLYGVHPADPSTFVGVSLFLVAVTILSCWLPARHATRVNPIEALRSE